MSGTDAEQSVKQKRTKPDHLWKPGQSGNPRGRPRKPWTFAEQIRAQLDAKDPSGRLRRVLAAKRLVDAVINTELDSDAIKAAREIRQALDGDSLSIQHREPFEVDFDRQVTLADLATGSETDRVVPGGNGHNGDG